MPFNRVLKRIPGHVLGTRFGGFCEWYLRFGCPKHDPGDAQDRPDPGDASLKKGDPGRHTTPTVTRFRTGHLAEVVALSSNGDCGATPLSVCLVATLVTIT